MSVIQARDLYKCYAGFAPVLRGASIEVEAGEMAAIMGPSGCGKSTMLHILGLLHAPDSGSLEILGTDVLRLNREQTASFRRSNLGFVMQASNLFEHSTVFENVEFPLIYENVPPDERWGRVIRALELVRLSGRVHYRSNRLSGGEQQRVAIARAMVNNPRILLADEPTGALDARTSVLIMENFRKLCHEGGVAMIMVTHDPKMADYCDSIYTLEDGKLVCKKHSLPTIKPDRAINFLNPPEPIVRGALVSLNFPGPWLMRQQLLARRLHEALLLMGIYRLKGSFFARAPKDYALPLPIRQAGPVQRFKSTLAFILHARHRPKLWQAWRKLPKGSASLPKRLEIFGESLILESWARQDALEMFVASDAKETGITVWAAARTADKPYTLVINPADLASPDSALKILCEDAALVLCPSEAVIKELQKLLPHLPSEKILLVRPQPSFQADDEPPESEPGKPIALLGTGASFSEKGWRTLVEAASLLAGTAFAFQLGILDEPTRSQKRLLQRKGLAKISKFYGLPGNDGQSEIFRASDIFIACAPESPGGDLALPLSLCEAMASGLCILALGTSPGMAEALKDRENCLVIPVDKPAELAEAIRNLASKPEERRKLGLKASKFITGLLNIESSTKNLTDRMVLAAAPADPEKPGF